MLCVVYCSVTPLIREDQIPAMRLYCLDQVDWISNWSNLTSQELRITKRADWSKNYQKREDYTRELQSLCQRIPSLCITCTLEL